MNGNIIQMLFDANVPLWEMTHPYYCAEGNFYASPDKGMHTVFESWADFAKTYKGKNFNQIVINGEGNVLYDFDDDLNTLWRWDWKKADPNDYEADEEIPGDELRLYFMLQRKGTNCSVYVSVTEADEPQIRQWLQTKAEYIKKLWEPFL